MLNRNQMLARFTLEWLKAEGIDQKTLTDKVMEELTSQVLTDFRVFITTSYSTSKEEQLKEIRAFFKHETQ